jgi:hypothetical protein
VVVSSIAWLPDTVDTPTSSMDDAPDDKGDDA